MHHSRNSLVSFCIVIFTPNIPTFSPLTSAIPYSSPLSLYVPIYIHWPYAAWLTASTGAGQKPGNHNRPYSLLLYFRNSCLWPASAQFYLTGSAERTQRSSSFFRKVIGELGSICHLFLFLATPVAWGSSQARDEPVPQQRPKALQGKLRILNPLCHKGIPQWCH